MPNRGFLRIALLALLVVLFQGTWALAGTTGTLTGNVVLNDGTPLAGAKVTATSPSESNSTTTDATGHFGFVSLIPDTYTIVVSKDGYDSVSQAGVTVVADNTQSTTITTQKSAKILGTIPVRAAAELVKPGTTADVYSVNSKTAAKLTGLGGGGGQDNAYSALASLPGLYVPQGQAGWYQAVYIRGGDYDQVGYEYDGVPVNRSFDNYPTTTASSLGQQSLQVYTGAAPANAESQGLAGFINQVIKTGTYPGFGSLDLGIGGPNLYNKLNFEVGGATPDRNFSYYIGLGGYNLGQRYVDQNNGSSLTQNYGVPYDLAPCPAGPSAINFTSCYGSGFGPGGYVNAPFNFLGTSGIAARETVANIHIGLPHHSDSGKDDIQLLYSTSLLRNPFYSSVNDLGGQAFLTQDQHGVLYGDGTAGPIDPAASATYPFFFGGFQYNGHLLDTFTNGVVPGIVTYDTASTGAAPFSNIPAGLRDSSENGQGIGKIQYQHNMGSNAYLRIYGYSYYSWWFLSTPSSTFADLGFGEVAGPQDYELTTHTRGASATFADQINAKNLINLEASMISASTVRNNNTQGLGAISGTRSRFAVLVNANSPQSGLCYNVADTTTAVSCEPFTLAATFVKYATAAAGTETDVSAMTCGSGPCTYMVAENGPWATYNTVKPTFSAVSLTDQYKASDKLLLNIGLRVDRFAFKGSDTSGGARNFWFNAWNQSQCVSTVPGSKPFDKMNFLPSITNPCSDLNPLLGGTFVPATLTNVSAPTFTYTETQPRIGGTYTLSADDVLRFSYGKYVQAPNAAFQQYNSLEQNLPSRLGNQFNFYAFGFTTPGHQLGPSESFNTDFSWEHHFKGSDVSFKLSPFYRKTKNQYQNFFLDQLSGFVSGLPIGAQVSEGTELQLNKGDFSANGLSAQFSFTYTHSYVTLATLSNGGTVFSPVNNSIVGYNQNTAFCQTNFGDPRCGSLAAAPANAAPCYNAGVPDPGCAPGSVANPYWNAPVQALFDTSAHYIPFDIIPNLFNSSVTSYEVPYVSTLILSLKHDKWALTPAFQFHAGGYYGAPLQTLGINPATCGTPLGSPIAGDPRYPYGAPGGSPYDALNCGGGGPIPNPFTGSFDQPGAFRAPSRMTMHLQATYEASTRMTLVASVLNVFDRCYGGSTQKWTVSDSRVCGYGLPVGAANAWAGNSYNPGAQFQGFAAAPYAPVFAHQPVSYGLEAKISL